MDNDVSLLKLATPLDFSKIHIQPACLPYKYANSDFQGTSIVASGWGTLASGGKQPSILQKVDLPVLTTAECRRHYGTSMITENMLCTYKPGQDTCQGDSGGSIDLMDANGCYNVIGVVSWGVGCAGVGQPGVYAKASKYLDWISANAPGEQFFRP
jgi:secreted trypsin-like serine protease